MAAGEAEAEQEDWLGAWCQVWAGLWRLPFASWFPLMDVEKGRTSYREQALLPSSGTARTGHALGGASRSMSVCVDLASALGVSGRRGFGS